MSSFMLFLICASYCTLSFLCIAKAFWNHRHCRWFSLYKKITVVEIVSTTVTVLATVDNNDTVSKGFIWFHSKNKTIKREVKLSFRTETMLISLSNWNLSTYPRKNSKNHYHSSNSDKYTTYYRFC